MKTFENKTAVITGAGSGIGRALAFEAAQRGMNLVLADINEKDLLSVKENLEPTPILATVTDVSDYAAVEKLAQASQETFGPIHLLFNNAGVSGAPKPLWESSLQDWEWVVGVNQMSVVYGVKAFVPGMLGHSEPAHIINTASITGLTCNSRLNSYAVTKHAVVALSETLYLDLQEVSANIGVSVLCPAWIKTKIHLSERNRPKTERTDLNTLDAATAQTAGALSKYVEGGLEPTDVAKTVFEGIENDTFYILTHEPFNKFIERRAYAILTGGKPRASW